MQSYYPQMRVNFVHLTIEMTFNSYSITYSCVISQFTCIQINKEANRVWLCINMRCLHLLILMDAVLKWAHIRLTSLITNTEHTLFTLNWPFANLKAPLKDSTSSLNNLLHLVKIGKL